MADIYNYMVYITYAMCYFFLKGGFIMPEIYKPAQTTYWIAKDADGNVVHVGVVEPHQVVTTPQATLVGHTTKIAQIEDIESFAGPQPAFNYDYDEIAKIWKFLPDQVIYMPVASGMASALNNALYQCIKPGGSGQYAGEIPHQTWPNYVLFKLNRTDVVPVDLSVDPTPLQNALAIAVAGSGITQEEADTIVSDVQANAGNEVDIISFVPDSWLPYVLTHNDAIRLGYISDEGV